MITVTNQPITILIVDDDEGVRASCRLMLSQGDYHLLQAESRTDAFAAARARTIDLFLIDLSLPDGDGLDLVERLRELQPHALFIVITGQQSQELLLRSLQLGVKNYLLKPFTGDQLVLTVEQTLADDQRLKERIRLKILTPLFDLSEGFLADIHLQTIFHKIVQMAREQTQADVVSLMVVDDASQELVIAASIGLPPEVVAGTKIRQGEGIAGWVASMKEPVILIPGVSLPPVLETSMYRNDMTAALCVPLMRKGKVVGVLNIGKRAARASFLQGDLELVSVLCRQAAVLIDNVRLFSEVTVRMGQLERAHFDTIKALAGALESKDLYTRDHSDRTVAHADLISQQLGLSPQEQLHTRYAAILHDIGKIGIPEQILNKPGRLTIDEYEIMKQHPAIGASIVSHIDFLKPVLPLILHDHERWDGRGYPHGLSGSDIPLGSRIISVVDAYDAMAVDRVYRKAPGHRHAIQELRRCAGSQFDPRIVEAFLDVVLSPPSDGAPHSN